MKKKIGYTFTLLFLYITSWSISSAFAETWQWLLTLKTEPPGRPLKLPTAIYIDQVLERYYVVDAGNNRLLSFKKTGEFLSAFDADGQLKLPFDMVKDKQGNIWVVERGVNSLTKIELQSKTLERHTISDNEKEVFLDRLEIENETFYVLDKSSGQILAIAPDLKIRGRFVAPGAASTGFADFTIKNGSLWALERLGGKVFRFNMNGELVSTVVLDKPVMFPYALEIGREGIIYILDRHEGNIAVFNQNGGFQQRFLAQGRAQGRLYYPSEIKFDPWGRLCVVEEGNGRVEVFSQ